MRVKQLVRIKKWLLVVLVSATFCVDGFAQLNKSYFYTRGREFILEGRYRDAIESLNILLRSQTDEYEGYFLRGVAKYNLNDLHGAHSDFTDAIGHNPVYTLAFQYRGITRSRLGMYNEALEDFGKAIEMRPNFAGAYYSRAVTAFLNQQFESAIKDYNVFIRIEPLSVDGYVNRGTAKLYLKDTTAAMNDYNKAVQVNPYNDNGYLRRGLLYLIKGDTDKGIADMNSALSIDSTTAIGYFYRAMGQNQKGRINEALSDFGKAVEYDPTNSVAVFNRAILRSQIGDYNRAIDDYTIVAEQNPSNVLVYYNRAAVYAQIGDIQKAIDDYTKAIEIYGDFANAYLYRSSLKAALGDRRGYEADKRKAEQLISQYQSRFLTEGETAFADTSSRFSDIISFNADFDDKNMARLSSRTLTKFRPLSMYQLTFVNQVDTTAGFDHKKFDNENVIAEINKLGLENIVISNRGSDLPGWRLMELEEKYSEQESAGYTFARGVVSSLMKQYTTAMNYYSFLISDNTQNGLAYLNRAVTEAEMTEFMASLEGDYQNIAVQNDPVERLNSTKQSKTFDFSSIIADLHRAAILMPQFPHIFYNLGYMYTLKGDIPAAVENYSKAIELFPYFGEAYYNRGLLQLAIDEKEKGALDLSRAGEIGIEQAYAVINAMTAN